MKSQAQGALSMLIKALIYKISQELRRMTMKCTPIAS
jgi:hypothetical protein